MGTQSQRDGTYQSSRVSRTPRFKSYRDHRRIRLCIRVSLLTGREYWEHGALYRSRILSELFLSSVGHRSGLVGYRGQVVTVSVTALLPPTLDRITLIEQTYTSYFTLKLRNFLRRLIVVPQLLASIGLSSDLQPDHLVSQQAQSHISLLLHDIRSKVAGYRP